MNALQQKLAEKLAQAQKRAEEFGAEVSETVLEAARRRAQQVLAEVAKKAEEAADKGFVACVVYSAGPEDRRYDWGKGYHYVGVAKFVIAGCKELGFQVCADERGMMCHLMVYGWGQYELSMLDQGVMYPPDNAPCWAREKQLQKTRPPDPRPSVWELAMNDPNWTPIH